MRMRMRKRMRMRWRMRWRMMMGGKNYYSSTYTSGSLGGEGSHGHHEGDQGSGHGWVELHALRRRWRRDVEKFLINKRGRKKQASRAAVESKRVHTQRA